MKTKKSDLPLDDVLLAGVGGGAGADSSCGLTETQFPQAGKCMLQSNSALGLVFKQLCPYCMIFTSAPEGENLTVAHIFECILYGYVKRLTE